MSHPTLDRIPARGITKDEHDAFVAMTGRNYTDPYRALHLGHRSPMGGQVPPHSTTIIDPKVHPPTVH